MNFALLNSVVAISKNLKLLYVEDNQASKVASLSILEEIFEDIIVASDGKEGLEMFEKNQIDLIITDINMPIMNGLEMIANIRETDSLIPILILSAHNEPEYFLESIKYGVEGYIIKPIELKQFLETIYRVVEKVLIKKEHKKNLAILSQYQQITDKSAIVSKTDKAGIITYVNEQFCRVSGYAKEELIGKPHSIVRHPENQKELYQNLWHTIKDKKQTWQAVLKNLKKDGTPYYAKSIIN